MRELAWRCVVHACAINTGARNRYCITRRAWRAALAAKRNVAWAALLRLADGLGVPLSEVVTRAEEAGATAKTLGSADPR